MKKRKKSTTSTVMVGMFAAVLAVLSQISIPMPSGVPVTMQTFAVALTGCVLGWKMGGSATLVYLLIGAAGVPVFANFSGGLGALLGSTGGFLFGFVFLVAFIGAADAQKKKSLRILLGSVGIGICHLFGVIQFSLYMEMPLTQSFVLVSLPYLLKDAVSVILACFVGASLKKALRAANILDYAGL